MKAGARDGVILVTVLWTVALLAMLAVAASLTFRGFAGVTAVERDRSKADGLLAAGLEVAGGLVSSAGDTPLNAVETTVVLASGSVHLRLDDEGGRIDIGQAPPELLAALFRAIGAPNPDAIAKQIVAWRNDDIGGSQSAPASGVSANPAGPTTAQAPAVPPFSDVRQLLQVPGMRPEWVTAAAPLITVYGNPTVNPLTAPASVLAVLPGVTGARLAAFLEARRLYPTDATRLAGFLADAQSFLAAKAPQAVSVQLSADLEDGYAANAEAVIVSLKGDLQPYRVLAWKPSPPQPRL
jgi:general secretion pathway protein K